MNERMATVAGVAFCLAASTGFWWVLVLWAGGEVTTMERTDGRAVMWAEFVRTRDPELRERLVLEYVPLGLRIGRAVSGRLPRWIERGDLEGAAMVGLIEAVDKFRPRPGVRFETFAGWRIRGAVMDELRQSDWMGRQTRINVTKMRAAVADLEADGRAASQDEVATAAGLTVLQLEDVMHFDGIEHVPLEPCCGDRGEELVWLEDRDAPAPDARALSDEAWAAMERGLTAFEQEVVRLYYVEGLMMWQVGERLEVGESRVSQIHKGLLARLRGMLGGSVGS